MPEIRIINRQRTIEEIERGREIARAREIRHTNLVPWYLMRASDVPDAEYRAATMGVRQALAASQQDRRIVDYSNSRWSDGQYSSADWYLNKAQEGSNRQHRNQVSAISLIFLMNSEPWQIENPHWDIMIVGTDLYSENNNNFVYGLTDSDFPTSVQSVNRFMEETNASIRHAMIRRLLRHEVGHMLGLPGWNRPNLTESLGTHCTNICTMRQGLSMDVWRNLTIQEESVQIHFCNECLAVLQQNKQKYRPLNEARS